MAQKKEESKKTGKALDVKSADAGKIKKRKPKKDDKGKIISKVAENVQKIMETTDDNSKKRKQEKVVNDKAMNENKSKNNKKGNANNQKKDNKNHNQNRNKKQKKNPDAGNKGKHADKNDKKETSSKEDKESSNKDDGGNNEQKWSKSKKKRLRALKAKQLKKQQQDELDSKSKSPVSKQEDSNDATTKDESSAATRGSKLQNAFKARLSGSRFRILNEELYTKDSKDSFARFSRNPELFEQYHEGFRHQVASWPVNPVDVIVRWIVNRYSSQIKNGGAKKKKKVVVADFGCGDAQLAKDLIQRHPDAFKIHSFDLVSKNPIVTACDMANVPLEAKSVDVVVFCLALMGTNLADFIREAHRVLKDNGRVQIAEVRSRIEYSHGRNNKKGENNSNKNDDDSSLSGTLDEFVQVLSKLGFECSKTDRSNKMFLFLELKKNGKVPNAKLEFAAKPCIYKRR